MQVRWANTRDREATASEPTAGVHVSLQGVTLKFEVPGAADVVAVNDLDLQIRRGEFVAVIGPSGCGKSTLLNMLSGLYTPTEGTVRIGDAPVSGISQNVGYVTQSDTLLPWMSVVDNVALPLRLRGRGSRTERRSEAQAWLDRVRLGEFGHLLPWRISGGMRSRAMLARTLIYQPHVLLMDEPFGKLDALMRLRMQDLLLDLWSAHTPTVVYITHDIDEALRLADRVVVMSHRPGRVLEEFVVSAARPRDIRHDREMIDCYEAIWKILQAEISAQERTER